MKVRVLVLPLALVAALTPTAGAARAASLTIVPPADPVGVGDLFDIRVEVQGTGQVDGAAAYVDLNPAILEIVSLTPGTGLPNVLQNAFYPFEGTVDFAAGNLSALPAGNFTIGRQCPAGQRRRDRMR